MPDQNPTASGQRAEVGELWRSVNRGVHEHFRQTFQEADLHFGAVHVLRYIKREPGVTVSELARRAGIAKSHVSKMIEQLCRRGYLEKRPDPSDQRLLHVHVTPAAADRVAEMEARGEAAWAGVMDQIPEGHLEDVARGLRILLTALEKSNARMSSE